MPEVNRGLANEFDEAPRVSRAGANPTRVSCRPVQPCPLLALSETRVPALCLVPERVRRRDLRRLKAPGRQDVATGDGELHAGVNVLARPRARPNGAVAHHLAPRAPWS
jgi:hypothetical protein